MSLLASAVTEWVSAVATGFTAAFAFAAVLQLFAIKRQTKQGALANVSESYGQISEQMASLRSILFEHHDWNKYFFNGDDPREDGVDDESEVGIQLGLVCDEIVDLADTIIEQRHTVPGAEMDWSTWELYLREIYQNSPLLQRYLRDNKQFYPDYVLTVFGYIIVRHADTGEVQSEWRVDEWPSDWADRLDRERLTAAFEKCTGESASDAEQNGYPWFRTWVITKMGKENEETPRGRRDPGDHVAAPEVASAWRTARAWIALAWMRREERDSGDPRNRAKADNEDPTFLAVVRAVPSDPETADVRFAWCGKELKEAERDLLSWVLEVLRASSRLKNAKVVFDPQTKRQVPLEGRRWDAWRKKVTRPGHKEPPRERYLAPAAPIRRPELEAANASEERRASTGP
jgi:hypothetical protein